MKLDIDVGSQNIKFSKLSLGFSTGTSDVRSTERQNLLTRLLDAVKQVGVFCFYYFHLLRITTSQISKNREKQQQQQIDERSNEICVYAVVNGLIEIISTGWTRLFEDG